MSEINPSNTTGLTFEKVLRVIHKNARQSRAEYQRFQKLLDKSRKVSKKRFKEIDKQFAESREELAESRKQIAEIKEIIRQTGEQMKQTDERMKQTDEQMKQTDERMKQTDERMKQTDERMDRMLNELHQQTKRTDIELGRLGNRFGEMIEHLVAAGVADRFNEMGYHFHGVSAGNFKAKDEKGQTIAEVDILLENDDFFVALEIKAKPRMDDIADHIDQLKILQQYFAKHRGKEKKVIGAIAGAVFADHIKKAVIANGLYAIVQSGDTIKIDVPKDFQPKLF
ncbi:MAG: hypothetical protein LBL62_03600 [Planctomycetaceae bacterium]|jgi:hypothetical protein|nr:hypothetical protein [Planctomycetaceae bacterium]